MSFYEEMADTADELLNEFGQKVTISRDGKTDYNPITGTTSNGAGSFDGIGVFEELTIINHGAVFNSDLIEIGDKKITIASKNLDEVPKVGDFVKGEDGVRWKVKNVKETNPAGISLIYELLASRQ